MHKLKQWANKLFHNSFFVSVFKVGSGQLIAQLMALVSVPILSRIYADTAYGDTALITSTAGLITTLSTFGLQSAVMKPEDDEECRTVYTTVFITNALISTTVTAVCALLIGRFQLMAVSESYPLALALTWIYCILYSQSSLMTVYSNRKKRYNRMFFNPIIGASVNFAVAIPLGLLGFGYVGFMLTNIMQYLLLCIHMMWGDLPFKKGYTLRDFRRVFVDYKDYVLYQYPSNFVGNFGIEYPTQYLGRVFTTQELGGYSMCVRVMKYPIRLIAAPISTVYFRTATEYHREGKNLAGFTYKMISRILLISVVPVAVFIFVSEPLFAFVLGKAWRTAGGLAGFLIIQYVLLFCSQTTSYCRVSIGRQRTDLAVTIVRLLVAVVSCTAGYALFHTMQATVFCYSLGQCLYNIYDMAVNFWCMDRRYLKKYVAISVLYTAAMFGVLAVQRLVI